MNCKSENVIYCATCPTCQEFYIGQTGRLIARVRVHKQQIRDPSVRNTPCCQHFAECGNGNFKIFPFYKLWNENESLRLSKEDYFIKQFNPKLNLVSEWEKREILEVSDELNDFPSVLKYIVGRKNSKYCVKVFFKDNGEKNDEKKHKPAEDIRKRGERLFSADEETNKLAKDLFRKRGEQMFSADETNYEFVNVYDELESIKTDVKKIKEKERNAPDIPLLTKTALEEFVDSTAEQIYAMYSNIVGIDLSNFLAKDQTETPCIVLYCLDKDLIPLGENELPRSIKEFACLWNKEISPDINHIPCDIREDILVFGSCVRCIDNELNPGCDIGSSYRGGSVGFLLHSPYKGFLTAAHVAVENIGDIYRPVTTDLTETFRRREEIWHPYKSPIIVGEVKNCIIGNYEKCGLDVAIVCMTSPTECSAEPNHVQTTLKVEDIKDSECPNGLKVFKRGNATGFTKGVLRGIKSSGRIDPIRTSGRFYFFNKCFAVDDLDSNQIFFKEGDSGSGVFFIDKMNRSINPLGIAFARLIRGEITLACEINQITKKFKLCIFQDAFTKSILEDQIDQEEMETDT